MQAQMQTETDRDLRNRVIGQVDWDPDVYSHDVGVAVKDCVVCLTGFVHRYSEKLAAERAAKSVTGVRGVANNIEVRPSSIPTDPEIVRDIVRALYSNSSVLGHSAETIKVRACDGYVTLEGVVDREFQRRTAAERANRISGVRSLANKIEVKARAAAH
jgi:osmotically-inducible protein OsmY